MCKLLGAGSALTLVSWGGVAIASPLPELPPSVELDLAALDKSKGDALDFAPSKQLTNNPLEVAIEPPPTAPTAPPPVEPPQPVVPAPQPLEPVPLPASPPIPLPNPLPPPPPEDRFLGEPRELELLPPDIEEVTPPIPETPQPPVEELPEDERRVRVESIEVRGSTVFNESDFEPWLAAVRAQTVAARDVQAIADQITNLYLEAGYLSSRAILNQGSLATGRVLIEVVEGRIEGIEIEGLRRVREDYVRDRVALGIGIPLHSGDLEDQLRLLRQSPLFSNVTASVIRVQGQRGVSKLIVRVEEAEAKGAKLGFNNSSPSSVGSERAEIRLSHSNLTGHGDSLSLLYQRTLAGGVDTLETGYQIPLNARESTLSWRSSWQRNEVVQEPFRSLEIRGESQSHEVSFRQPLWRSPREEFAVSVGFAYQTGQTFTFAGPTPFGLGPSPEGVTTTSVVKFEQDYLRRDIAGAWVARSQFSLGTGLFGATVNPGAIPDGHFFSWLGQVQRAQQIGKDSLLLFSADLQLASQGLLTSQQFVIGGAQSVRGYRQSARAGDNGSRLSLEYRWTTDRDNADRARFQLISFADLGWVWNNANNPNPAVEPHLLAGLGLGFIWQPIKEVRLRLDYGFPLVEIDDRGTSAQDRGIYISFEYSL